MDRGTIKLSTSFFTERLQKTESQIASYEDAIDFLIANPTRSYTLDTGQSSQTVTRYNLKDLQDQLNILYSRRDSILARCGNGTIISKPGW